MTATLIDQLEAMRARLNGDEHQDKLYLLQHIEARAEEQDYEIMDRLRQMIDGQAVRAAEWSQLADVFFSRHGRLIPANVRQDYVTGDPHWGSRALPAPEPDPEPPVQLDQSMDIEQAIAALRNNTRLSETLRNGHDEMNDVVRGSFGG